MEKQTKAKHRIRINIIKGPDKSLWWAHLKGVHRNKCCTNCILFSFDMLCCFFYHESKNSFFGGITLDNSSVWFHRTTKRNEKTRPIQFDTFHRSEITSSFFYWLSSQILVLNLIYVSILLFFPCGSVTKSLIFFVWLFLCIYFIPFKENIRNIVHQTIFVVFFSIRFFLKNAIIFFQFRFWIVFISNKWEREKNTEYLFSGSSIWGSEVFFLFLSRTNWNCHLLSIVG